MAQTVLTPPQSTAIDAHPGLSTAQVQERIARSETNDYKARVSRTYWDIVRDNVLNLFNIVLGTLLVIVVLSGDYSTAFFAGFSVVTNTFLGMIQEINAKRKLDQLATLSEQQVLVLRDGQRQAISMRAVVRDDVIVIEPGDKLVVDGRILHSDALEVDESLLTGESDAVFKNPDDEAFSGSFCIAGSGLMQATRVGKESNINKLSLIAKQYKNVRTPTQIYIDIVVELTVVIMFVFVPMLFITAALKGLPFLEAIRNSVVFVTSLVPQGLVLVAILSLTIGAIKISRHQTLIQKVNAVESLANATVLCFDKTGTLTMNQLAVSELIPLNGRPTEAILRDLHAYLHNLAHANRTAGAVREYVDTHVSDAQPRSKTRELPFNSTRKWASVIFEEEALLLGAPERLLPAEHEAVPQARKLSTEGMRVLAFARIRQMPDDLNVRGAAEPIALIVLSDQVRPDIQQTLQAFRDEEIELKVISGDNLETVRAIALQSGLEIREAYTGAEVDAMDDEELEAAALHGNVFGRVEPDTKRRIVAALQRRQHYVAMVGDGVNDVPALKQANLAIVMNEGTQISKDVADIVLLNNAMSTLPRAFHEGKEITQTVFGTMKMFLVKNVYNVALFIFIGFMSLPFPITPVQISWSTFGTVNIPATLVAFGLLRPARMRRFRDDVLDFIVTGGFMGAVSLALLYVVVYFASGGDITMTRSAITVYLSFYGALLICAIQGISFYDPPSFVRHWKTLAMMTFLVTFTIIPMYALPDLFEFYRFEWGRDTWAIVLIIAIFELNMIILAHGMRFRYLVHRMWALFQPR